jgi:NitT/TauT family transport system permease protein
MTRLDPRYAWVRQLAAFAVVLAVWEAAGRANRLNPLYAPSPSQVGATLIDLFSDGRIWPHLEATFSAALGGLALGIVVGVLLGIVAALVPFIAELLEPVMAVLNAIPRVILAPLFVIWLGIGLASKVALSRHGQDQGRGPRGRWWQPTNPRRPSRRASRTYLADCHR